MGREPMVTRTILSTTATALCINVETAEPCNETVVLSGIYKDKKALEKAVKKAIETDVLKVAAVVESTTNEQLYGMTEREFIALAKVLPPRGTKKVEEN